jgi:hypothetical protein
VELDGTALDTRATRSHEHRRSAISGGDDFVSLECDKPTNAAPLEDRDLEDHVRA